MGKKFVKKDEENKVFSIRFGTELLEGEIETDKEIETGDILNDDGSVTKVSEVPVASLSPLERIEQKIDKILLKLGV